MRQDGLERLVDANANRVREGLRTLEDLARFVLDASDLARDLKTIRHEITEAAARRVGPTATPRDTAGDVGTEHMTDGELARPGLVAVAEAAGGRVTEGCRSLEEAAKVLDVGGRVASALQSARYAAYDLAAAVTAAVARGRPSGWRVQVLLTESICRGPWTQVLESAIAGGADAIQVREKTFSSSELLDRVRAVIEIARPAGIPVIVNDRADIAVAAGADGVHLGQGDLPVEAARRVIGGLALLGGSAHDLNEAARNHAAGCDYCGVGRFAASGTKPEASEGGPALVQAMAAAYPRWPQLVIGGIDLQNIDQVIASGGRGVAMSAAICGAADPAGVVADVRNRLQQAVESVTSTVSGSVG